MFRWLFKRKQKTRVVEELGVKTTIHVYDSNDDLIKGLQGITFRSIFGSYSFVFFRPEENTPRRNCFPHETSR